MGKLTKQQQVMIGAVMASVAIFYVYFTMFLRPTLDKIKQHQAELADLQNKIDSAERQARRLPVLQSEMASLQTELAALEKQLPRDKDVPNIIRTVTREAMQQNLQFVRLAPRPPVHQQFFDILPFDVQFNGSLHGLGRFLAAIGQQERIFQAQNVLLMPGASAEGNLGAVNLGITLTLSTYAYSG